MGGLFFISDLLLSVMICVCMNSRFELSPLLANGPGMRMGLGEVSGNCGVASNWTASLKLRIDRSRRPFGCWRVMRNRTDVDVAQASALQLRR